MPSFHVSETPITETWILASKCNVLNTDNETEGINSHVEMCKPTAVHKGRKDVYHLLSGLHSFLSFLLSSNFSPRTLGSAHHISEPPMAKPVIFCSKIYRIKLSRGKDYFSSCSLIIGEREECCLKRMKSHHHYLAIVTWSGSSVHIREECRWMSRETGFQFLNPFSLKFLSHRLVSPNKHLGL